MMTTYDNVRRMADIKRYKMLTLPLVRRAVKLQNNNLQLQHKGYLFIVDINCQKNCEGKKSSLCRNKILTA